MSDLISKNAVIDIIENEIRSTRDYLQHDTQINIQFAVEELPVIEAAPVVHGEWIGDACSECDMNWNDGMVNNADDWGYYDPMPNFCTNCGARMDGKKVKE